MTPKNEKQDLLFSIKHNQALNTSKTSFIAAKYKYCHLYKSLYEKHQHSSGQPWFKYYQWEIAEKGYWHAAFRLCRRDVGYEGNAKILGPVLSFPHHCVK